MKHLVVTTLVLVSGVFFAHAQNPSVSPEDYSTQQIHLYVSPQGNDAWPGSQNQPKASLKGARDAVRKLKSGGGLTGPVHVKFADGEYPLMSPVIFAPEDNGTEMSPVIYEAMEGARPVFSGGRKIAGFRPGENGLWVTDVPGVASGQWYFEQLWVDGRRIRRAMEPDTKWEEIAKLPGNPGSRERPRNPDIDPFFFEDVVETDLDPDRIINGNPYDETAVRLGGGHYRQTSIVSREVINLLTPLSPAELADVQLSVCHSWDNSRRFISAIDEGSRTIITEGGRAVFNFNKWNDLAWGSRGYFHLENFLSALDEPGEWFLSRDGKLYYKPFPGEDPSSMEFVAPVTSQFLLIQGDPLDDRFVEHIHFKGLAFKHGQWLTPARGFGPAQAASPLEAAVMLDGTRNVLFQDCEIAHVGIYGIWFRRGNRHSRMERCLLRDLGAGGVRIGDAGREDNIERTHHITVDNNIIQSGGRIHHNAVGLWIGESGDNIVTHNDIGDFYSFGVSVGWNWNFDTSLAKRNDISYNRIQHLGQHRMSDVGGVYSLGESDGTIVSHNVIHDAYCWGYGGWGLYPDQASSNILYLNNLIYNVSDGGFHQHFGRYNIVRNNIFAFSEREQVRGTNQERAGDHLSFAFERNIVYFDQGQLFGRDFQWDPDRNIQVNFKNNIYWRTDGKDLDFAGRSRDEWRALGLGEKEGSIIADPMFVDPENYDFRFASDEVIRQTGFKPFDYSQAGVYGAPGWKALAADALPIQCRSDYEYKIEINDVKGPEWSEGLPLYEASIGRHTEEGTIDAFRRDLPRLKEMGTGIIWLMPLHPKGILKAKGSSYCIRDHFGVDESLGTKEDLKQLLDDIHDSGMYAILDVVARYTSWDHPLITSHPEYYVHRDDGTIAYPANWTDVAALDYSKQEVREWAGSYLEYWADFGFDGFRVDVAGMFPDDFWAEYIPQINKKYPGLFWLSESNKESHHDLFDMTYDWSMAPYLWKIFWNEWPATKLDSLLNIEKPYLEKGALIMRHAINHDTHGSWYPGQFYTIIPREILGDRQKEGKGNIYYNYGEGMKVANVLYATLPGKYMIYNAQDANHRERGKIEWGDKSMYPFYKSLFELHKNTPAIFKRNFYKLKTNMDDNVFAFMRESGDEKVLVLTNLSVENKTVQIESKVPKQKWEEYFTGEKTRSLKDIELNPYGYKVYISQ